MKISQRRHANALLEAMHALDERAAALERATDLAAFDWHPPEGGWSAGQVFEHLCVANDSYLVVLRRLLPSAPRAGDGNDRLWQPSWLGGLLARSMESSRKYPAPRKWPPGPAPRPNVVGEFLVRQREIEQWIERSVASDWQRIRLASPASAFVRMNVGDAFTILVRHAERHFRQIDRVLARRAGATGGHVMANP